MVLISGDISINLADLSVRRAGATLKLEPLTLDLLLYLVRNHGRLITKDELFTHIWKGAFVSEASVTQAIAVLRKLLADSGRQQRMIETVRGRGYRFVGPLRPAASTATLEASGNHSAAASPSTSSPFVGRHRLMRELDSALEEALSGRGSIAMLHGEPGSGKTRSTDEFARLARARGVRSFSVGAVAVASGRPYWPWLQIIESMRACGLGREARAEGALRAVLDALRPREGRPTPNLEMASVGALDSHRLRLFERVVEVLRAVAAYTPIILVFDDLHDADIASMRLLDFVGRSLGNIASLVMLTYRDAEVQSQAERMELIAGLSRLARTRDEALGGLARSESGRLFEALTSRALDAKGLDVLYQRTAGNPFFLHQLARLEIAADGASEHTREPASLPAGVIESITQHLASLSERSRQTLGAVAVFGVEARPPLLAAMLGRDLETVLHDLGEAVEAGVLLENGGVYRFNHALIAEALEGALHPEERAQRHLLAAQALVAAAAGDAEIAHHLYEARAVGGAAACVRYARRAADAAMEALAFDEAADLYARALDALDHLDAGDEQRLQLLLGLGMARARAGKLAPGESALRRVMEIARRCGDAESFAWAAFGVWLRSEKDRGDPQLIADLEEALARYGAETPLRVQLLAQLAQALWFIPPRERARELALEAVALGRRLDDPDSLTLALTRAHRICHGSPEEMPRRFQFSAELRRVRPRVKDPGLRLEGRWHTIWDALTQQDRSDFDIEVGALCADAEDVGEPFAMWHTHVFTACRALADGDLRRAETDTEAALRIAPPGMHHFADHVHALQTISRLYLQGDFAALAGVVAPRARRELLGWKLEQLRAAVLSGDHGEAAVFIREKVSRDFPQGTGFVRDVSWLSYLSLLAEICSRLRLRQAGSRIYRELLPFAGYQESVGAGFVPRGSVSRYLGTLSAVAGDHAAAEAHFERALRDDGRFGNRTALAFDRLEIGRTLMRRGEGEATARARMMLHEAHESATALGMRWVAAEAAALLKRGRASLEDP